MLERLNPFLRIVCFALAALVLFQAARVLTPRGRALAEFTPENINTAAKASTNSPNSTNITSTNITANSTNSPPRSPAAMAKADPLPPEINARIEKIKDSQILGQIMRPPPMAVIGLAGKEVLLRTDSGQTDWVAEGAELGGVKILKIGTNRVLVEQQGQKKELTLFQGFGSESLLGKETSK